MVTRLSSWTVIVCAMLLGACSATRQRADISYDTTSFTSPDSQFVATGDEGYRIGPMDVVTVSVFEVPQMSGDFEVSGTGKVNLPLVGGVDAQNKTANELSANLTQALGAKYFQNPDVTVTVKEVHSQRVTLDGSIGAPGIYPVSSNLSLLQAVAMAKGLSQDANPSRVVVFRTISGRRAAAAFDLNKVREGLTPDPKIYGNDLIVVDGSRSRAALRDVVRTLPLLALFRFF